LSNTANKRNSDVARINFELEWRTVFNLVAQPVAFGSLRAAVKSAHVWLFSRPDAAPVKSHVAASRPIPAEASARPRIAMLSAAEQWARVSGVLIRSGSQASHARELQGLASQQIDLATYAFNSIIDELSAVMALPARREPAVVHLFEPSLARSHVRAGVAANRAA
jgi:hypothetical protein